MNSANPSQRPCAWPPCGAVLPVGSPSRRLYCSQACRQAAWRFARDLGRAEAADRPLRLAYADPPYPGLARKYYGDHPDYGGEVDHRALLSRLEQYDGWALSTSARALPQVLALAAHVPGLRVGVWVRGHRPAAQGVVGPYSAWEPVLYRGARPVPSSQPGVDVLEHFHHPRRAEGQVVGAKPWAFCRWLFADMLQARAGDQLDDLFPGSGGVRLAWERWSSRAAGDDEEAGEGRGRASP